MVKIVIGGAGPAGLLLAQHLITHPNYDVHIFEKRPDPLTGADKRSTGDRTYPMSIQGSGLGALEEIPGLQTSLNKRGKWMQKIQQYNNDTPRLIEKELPSFMVERHALACGMLEYLQLINDNVIPDAAAPTDDAESLPHRHPSSSLSFHFGCGIDDVCLDEQVVTTDQGTKESFDHIVAADGARSVIRTKLTQKNVFDSTVETIGFSYRPVCLPITGTDFETDRMHGWFVGATDQIMLVPLNDEQARGVYVFPTEADPFAGMTTAQEVIDYFRTSVSTRVADVLPDHEARNILNAPVATNLKVHCNALTSPDGKAVLVGDAAHAVSASIGLGCNSALQDIQVLAGKLDKHDHNWHTALQEYNSEHIVDAHAVCELSDNTMPRTSMMRIEMVFRLVLRRLLPKILSKWMRPLPMELTNKKNLRFSEMLRRCRWWTDRVKASKPKAKEA